MPPFETWVPAILLAFFQILATPATAGTISLPSGIEGDGVSFVALSDFGSAPGISGFTGTVRAIVTVTSGAAKISTTTGLTAPTGYSSSDWTTGAAEIGFEGSTADVDTALATLAYKGASATLTVDVVPGGSAYNPDTGSYYEYVSTPLTWAAAKTAAEGMSFDGASGYLATVTTSAELNFLLAKVGVGTQVWLGGTDGAVEDTWRWVNSAGVPAAERDAVFFTNNATADDAADFWCSGEPNDSGGAEDALQINAAGCWNDLPDSSSTLGYIVEYTPTSGGSAAQETRSITAETVAPTLAISAASTTLVPGGTTTVTFTFSETPVGFTSGDISVSDGSLSAFAVSGTDDKVYTATYTAGTGGGTVTISVADDSYTDTVGNNGSGDSLDLTTGSPATEFEEHEEEIRAVIVGAAERSLRSTMETNRRLSREARTRFILGRFAASGEAREFATRADIPFDIHGVVEVDQDAIRSVGTFFQQHGTADGGTRRLFFGDFDVQSDEDATTATLTGKLAWERMASDRTMLGYFIGGELAHSNVSGSFEGDQNSFGVSVGGYFTSQLRDRLYADGFVSFGIGQNALEMGNGTLELESDYRTRTATVGAALTGVIERSGYAIWPELALTYGKTFIGNVDFTGTAYGLVDNNLSLDAGNVSILNLTLRPEVRVPVDGRDEDASNALLTFSPRLLCERVVTSETTEDCGAGAEIGFAGASADGMAELSARVSFDRIGSTERAGLQILFQRRF